MRSHLLSALCLVLCGYISQVRAQSYDEELAKLSTGLGASLEKAGLKTVAVGGFKDLNGKEPGLGKLLIEDLSVDLVNQNKGVSVVDRANLSRLMEEYKLTEEGLVDPENTKKLKLEGIDAIILGTIVPFDNTYRVQLKAIATDSAKVVAATRGSITKTESLDSLMGITQIQATAHSAGSSVQPSESPGTDRIPKKKVYEFNNGKVEIRSVEFFKQTGKVRVIYAITMSKRFFSSIPFFYHLVDAEPPHRDYDWRNDGRTTLKVAGEATDDQEHTYKTLLPFDPFAHPMLGPEEPAVFKLEYKIANADGAKIQIPDTFTFWFEFFYQQPFENNLVRCSIAEYPFDKIQ